MAAKSNESNKEISKKTVRAREKPLTTSCKPDASEKRIQTAEGWKRGMLRSRKAQKKGAG